VVTPKRTNLNAPKNRREFQVDKGGVYTRKYKPPFLEFRQVSVSAIWVASRFDLLLDHLVFFQRSHWSKPARSPAAHFDLFKETHRSNRRLQ
jgi:hypothetical protein